MIKILRKHQTKPKITTDKLNLKIIKKLYKTKNGILTFLDYQMKNWTEKHRKIK